jgi:proteic killer suppression protein
MIVSFTDKETEKIWQGIRSRKLPPDIQERALRKLRQLEASTNLDDLRLPPGNRLEALSGDRAGQHMEIEQDNTASVLLDSGESVLFGKMETPIK